MLLAIEELMGNYKRKFDSKIYFLNYENLVLNPEKEIKKLLSWLGWEYQNKYLDPKLDSTTLKKSSNTLINTRHINSWRNYKELLQPAIEIICNDAKYSHLIL